MIFFVLLCLAYFLLLLIIFTVIFFNIEFANCREAHPFSALPNLIKKKKKREGVEKHQGAFKSTWFCLQKSIAKESLMLWEHERWK